MARCKTKIAFDDKQILRLFRILNKPVPTNVCLRTKVKRLQALEVGSTMSEFPIRCSAARDASLKFLCKM